jgi:hypothetical protein
MIGQLHVSSNLLPLRDPLTQGLSGHIAGESSVVTLPGFERPILWPIACYYFDFVKHVPILSKSFVQADRFTSYFPST